jgi:beta-glucosidase/6-phospho-beta-glucosidase/beta-galactosidase
MKDQIVPALCDISSPLFRSFFLGGFECSTHKNYLQRRQLDLIASTRHDIFARQDYKRLQNAGIRVARDGIRWHLIEREPYHYDWSSVLPMVHAARDTNTQIIWDLCHYGWPDDLDVFSPAFLDRFAALTRAFTRLLNEEQPDAPYLSPVNEISFVAWAGGHMGLFPPFATERGMELKPQLARAAIVSCEAAWEIDKRARMFHIDPICNVAPRTPEAAVEAERIRVSQYEAWDMIAGTAYKEEVGGDPKYLDVVGVNYYPDNQWAYPDPPHGPPTIGPDNPYWVHPALMLKEAYERFGRPLFIAETGTEWKDRASWLAHIGREVRSAIRAGVPVEGVCLYPILNHPGWEDDRHCHNGLWDYAKPNGTRKPYSPMLRQLRQEQARFARMGYP